MPNHDRFECQTAIDSDAILQNALTCVPAPGGTGCFWHVGCLPLKYLTLPESGDFRPRPAAYFRAS